MIETLRSGRKRWQFRRRLKGGTTVFKINLGFYPRYSIGEAREWAGKLNAIVDAGRDPREVARADAAERAMTVDFAHELYMIAVHEGRSSHAKRPNKPRTISDKLEIFKLDIQPVLGKKLIKEVIDAIPQVKGTDMLFAVPDNIARHSRVQLAQSPASTLDGYRAERSAS